jgi:hypothetical protein
MIRNQLVAYYIDREFGGSKLSKAKSDSLTEQADALYKKAGSLRKEAAALKNPRRN